MSSLFIGMAADYNVRSQSEVEALKGPQSHWKNRMIAREALKPVVVYMLIPLECFSGDKNTDASPSLNVSGDIKL